MNDRVIEKARFYEVTGPIDNPTESGNGIAVLFNPSSLKVTLANSLKENERSKTGSAAQYVDKSSSSLSVELIFDTTDVYTEQGVQADVRLLTGEIAEEFMHQKDVGDKKKPPKRCMFAWGTFCFVGIMESFDETLDYFSSEGAPLRATVSIKMTESRFQFRSREAQDAERETPVLGRSSDSATDANANAGNDPKDWRDTSMYNGLESPRMPSTSGLAVPSLSASASFGASISGGFQASGAGGAGVGLGVSSGGVISAGSSTGVSAGVGAGSSIGLSTGVSAGVSVGASTGFSGSISSSGSKVSTQLTSGAQLTSSVQLTPPAFKYGASSSLGTGIPGAFSTNTKVGGGFSAGSIIAIKSQAAMSATARTQVISGQSSNRLTGARIRTLRASANIGFD